MKLSLIGRVVAASCRISVVLVVLCLGLGAASVFYTMHHFAMTTDTAQLISPNLPWRKNSAALDRAFPQQSDLIAVVIDAQTPELANVAAARLAAALTPQKPLMMRVTRPDGGPFFERNGLLLLPLSEVQNTTNQLIAAQPFLGALAADPSLRGVMSSLSVALQGVQVGQAKLEDIDTPLRRFGDTLDKVERGQPAFFSWRAMISGQAASTRELRQFVLVQPKLDYGALMPGERASDAIRQTARELHLDPQHGVRVRLTGSVPLADEEFASLADNAWLITTVMAIAVVVMLWLAVRSVRIIICILVTTILGLLMTAGLGLLTVGRFNLISVAFIPLFVGLGVDFGIQFSVRYRAERLTHPDLREALIRSGEGVGHALALAAVAVSVGFFAFLPTSYIGVSELGVIAGFGMIIAFVLSLTLLPALICLAHPRGESQEVGYAQLEPLDRYLLERRGRVLRIFAGAAVVSVLLLPFLRFDFNPLHLRNRQTESMQALAELMKDPDRTPNTIDVLTPSLAAADALAKRLSALPQVDQAVTLSSFVPNDQPQKLALIADAAMLLGPTLNPPVVQPPPTDAEVVQSLTQTAASLRAAAGAASTPSAKDALRLAGVLDRLASGPASLRARASQVLMSPWSVVVGQLRETLQASPITLQSLPPDLVRDWLAPTGQARVEAFPKGDSNNNKVLTRFSRAVQAIAPNATGTPISIQEAGRTVVNAFLEAGVLSFVAITILLGLVLRRVRDVLMTVTPILLTGLLTLGTCVILGQAINFANIIALPLLFGIGVAFNIYFVMAWRSGETNLLTSSLTRAVLFSALTTGTSFGSLCLSSHPGTASMGWLLMISLGWTLVVALLFEPALLGPCPPETTAPSKRAI